jgi:hypothetical protein
MLTACLADLIGLARQFSHDPKLAEEYVLEATRITARLKDLQIEIEELHLD